MICAKPTVRLWLFGYLIAKLLFWDWLIVGIVPISIGIFFFSSVQLFFLGILGENIGTILTQVQKRPLVIEKERINFASNPRLVSKPVGEFNSKREANGCPEPYLATERRLGDGE